HEERSLVVPNKRRETPHRAKTGPALRVGPPRLRGKCRHAALRDLAREPPLPASRALPGDIWRSNAARDETATDPRRRDIMSDTSLQSAQPERSGEPVIQMQGVNKWFGQFHVLKDIDLSVTQGERIVLCGPSGSGKSTTIRCLNRLEEHQQGRIVINGVELTNDLKQIEAIRSEVGMVFQHFNLFPHLTVLQNCMLAPMWVRK